MQTFDPDLSNMAGGADKTAEKLPVSALDGQLFDGGNRRSAGITVAAECHSFGDAPGVEICLVKRLDLDRAGELFLQRRYEVLARERPAADHKHSGADD